MAETRITRDAVVPMAAIAGATERIRVGTAIMNVFTRGPVVVAITFVSLEGRAGPDRDGTGAVAADSRTAGTAVRKAADATAGVLRGAAPADARRGGRFEGDTIRLEEARIEDLLSSDGIASEATEMPLYLGVTGPRSLALAGEFPTASS